MKSRAFEETKSVLHYSAPVAFDARGLAEYVSRRMAAFGYSFDSGPFIDENEIEIDRGDQVLSICVDSADPNRIVIAVDSPTADTDRLRDDSFRMCVAATKLVIDQFPSKLVRWEHLNRYFITEDGELVQSGRLDQSTPAERGLVPSMLPTWLRFT